MTGDRDAEDIQKLFDLQGATDGKVDQIRESQIRLEERVVSFLNSCVNGNVHRCIINDGRISALEKWRDKTESFWSRLFWVVVTAGVGASAALLAKLIFQ